MTARPLEGRRILVVEDDYMIAQDVTAQLEAAGVKVIGPAPSVVRALRLLGKEERVDAAVLDVNLGDENSLLIAQTLQDMNVPFLFSTGYNSADVPSDWRHLPIMMKPLRLADVSALLQVSDAP